MWNHWNLKQALIWRKPAEIRWIWHNLEHWRSQSLLGGQKSVNQIVNYPLYNYFISGFHQGQTGKCFFTCYPLLYSVYPKLALRVCQTLFGLNPHFGPEGNPVVARNPNQAKLDLLILYAKRRWLSLGAYFFETLGKVMPACFWYLPFLSA